MNRDDIAALAQEAGFSINDGIVIGGVSDLERFTELVAASEREACARAVGEVYNQHDGVDMKEIRYGIAVSSAAIRTRGKS